MKVLVTGSEGFVGPYLVAELEKAGHTVRLGTLKNCDITDVNNWREFVSQDIPDAVIHLAALSGYAQCLKDPQKTWQTNTFCVEQIASEFARLKPEGRFLFVSSGKIYAPSDKKISEVSPMNPADFYGLTKMSADLRLGLLVDELPLTLLRARPFNHTGAGQPLGFLCSDLVARLRESVSRQDQPLSIEVGSVGAQIDLTDVRDVVRGYRLLLEKGETGDVVNFGQGQLVSIAQIIEVFSQVIDQEITCVEKQQHNRPYSQTLRLADISKAKKSLGWEPEISLEQTLKDLWFES